MLSKIEYLLAFPSEELDIYDIHMESGGEGVKKK